MFPILLVAGMMIPIERRFFWGGGGYGLKVETTNQITSDTIN